MSFFKKPFEIDKRVDLALNRTYEQFKRAEKYAEKNPVNTSLLTAGMIVAALYFPAPVILTLCMSALVLIGYNLFKDPTDRESISEAFSSLTKF